MRRALIFGGLTAALLAAASSPASAATITPATADFGRVLIGKRTPPRTFTFTKGNEMSYEIEGIDGPSHVINYAGGSGFSQTSESQLNPNCPAELTAAHPSCTIQVYFEADSPGITRATVVANYSDPSGPLADLVGIGLFPSNSYFCTKYKGKYPKPNLVKWCQNKQKKKKKKKKK